MERFLYCLSNQDVAGAEALLAADVRHLGDGGGEFIAARKPVIGREKVARFNLRLAEFKPEDIRITWRMINGMPAIVMELLHPPEKYAPRIVTACELDADGNIKRIFNVLASRKLTALR